MHRAGFSGLLLIATALSALAVLLQPVAAQTAMGFALHEHPRPVAEIRFANGQGEPMSLDDFRGKVVLLNIWATWCVPCRREMPTLDRLQAELGGLDFEVVALSVDRQGLRVVVDFYQELGLRQLGIYNDMSAEAPRKLKAPGIPTTLLLDRDGNELGRLLGPAEWDSPEMVSFLRGYVERPSNPSWGTVEQISAHALRGRIQLGTRGPNRISAAPPRQIRAPITSHRSGRAPSISHSQPSEAAM
jgi:thiol-disulfide isomerase/thioredoxin